MHVIKYYMNIHVIEVENKVNPIRLLVEWRFDNFVKEFNMSGFMASSENFFIDNGDALKQKLTVFGYTIDINEDSTVINSCYCFIKNIIWKNIINYENILDMIHVTMIHINYKDKYITKKYRINKNILLNQSRHFSTDNYISKMHNIIINYILLINDIVTSNLILDLLSINKQYMFDAMLII